MDGPKKYKVLITSTSFSFWDDAPSRFLEDNGCELIYKRGPFDDKALSKLALNVDAMIVGVDKVGKKTISNSRNLRVAVVHGRGVDNVDLELAKKRGLVIDNLPSVSPWTVAEFTFALLLNLMRKVQVGIKSLKEGKWERKEILGNDLRGKTLGIIGLGNIGECVVKIAEGFEMKPIYYDTRRRFDLEKQTSVRFEKLDNLVSVSDIITLHVPKTDQTINLISYPELEKMKESAYILNLSRGGIINEEALYQALVNKRIRGAALDVYAKEPPGKDCRFLSLESVIATPHMASYTAESTLKASMTAARKLMKHLRDLVEASKG